MKIENKVVVVTGAAAGIGAAFADVCLNRGARAVVLADLRHPTNDESSRDPRVLRTITDVTQPEQVAALVATTIERFGCIDVFFSNAGVMQSGGVEIDPKRWTAAWDVNVLSHVHCAREALPHMVERGEGYFIVTSSAAGLLTALGAAPYAVTKHAALAFAEWLAISYGKRGIRISALCPAAVDTEMLAAASGGDAAAAVRTGGEVMSPTRVAEILVEAIDTETFLVITHPEVKGYVERKSTDIEGWIRRMSKLGEVRQKESV